MFIDLDHVTPLVRHAAGARRRHAAPGAGPHRPARAQRGRQIDAAEDPARPAAAVVRHAAASSATTCSATAGTALRRAIGYMPEADALVPGLRGAEYVALAGELYGMPRTRGPAPRPRGAHLPRPGGRPLPPARGILHRHEAAPQAGPGPGPRPAGAAARRADQRPRPGRPRGDAAAAAARWAATTASRSCCPRTCSATSSRSARRW